MEQDRWMPEEKKPQRNYKGLIALGVIAAAVIGLVVVLNGKSQATKLSLDKTSATLKVGLSDKLIVTVEPGDLHPDLIWRSSDESVVSANGGLVIANKAGKADVTVSVKDQEDIVAICEYTVEETEIDMESIYILEDPLILRPGGHQQLNVSCTPEGQNENILWSSTDESVVRVTPKGKIEALRVGTASIIATSERTGLADTAFVSVEGAGVPVDKPVAASKPVAVSKPVTTSKPVATSKPAMPPVKPATTSSKPASTAKPAATSGGKDFGYAVFKGSWPNDVRGRMVFKSTHIIDSRDPKRRMASPGDYVVGEWSEGHLVQGVWYGSDNQAKGSILIGK